MNSPSEIDIGPLSWVKGEIDLSLERAGAELHTHTESPAGSRHLAAAQAALHQAHGALAVVGLAGITEFSQALEQLLAAVEQGEITWSNDVEQAAQQGMAALRNYLDGLVNGQPNQPLGLLPVYRSLQSTRGVAEVAASDLFFPDLTQRPPRREVEPPALEPDTLAARLKAARLGFERGLLKWLRNDAGSLREMRNAVAIIEMTQSVPAARAPWWVALAVFDALALDGVEVTAPVRRLGARIDAQIRKLLESSATVSERLMRDMLYVVATSAHSNEHIDSVRYAYRLADLIPRSAVSADREPQREHQRALREQVALARERWDEFCTGVAAALPPFHECTAQLVLHGEPLKQVDLIRLVSAIANIANMLRKNPLAYNDSIAVEVATALLLTEHAAENFEQPDAQLGVEFARQVDVMAGRLSALLRGEALATMESLPLDEISRRARERLAMRQTVREMQAHLAVVEQSLDGFFRNPARNRELAGLATPLRQIDEALAALGEKRALEVLAECVESIGQFAATGYSAEPTVFEDVARKISALGLFLEQRLVGPADIDAILSPALARQAAEAQAAGALPLDTVESELAGRTEMTHTLVGALRAAPQDQALRGELKQNLQDLREDAQLVADSGLEQKVSAALAALESGQSAEHIAEVVAPLTGQSAAVEISGEAARLADAVAADVDAELLGVFLDEASEVLETVAETLPRVTAEPDNHDALMALRRGFHTLKGSGRMVGLGTLAGMALTVEEVLNRWLKLELPATPPMLAMIRQAHALFSGWVVRLRTGDSLLPDTAALVALCEQLQNGETPAVTPLVPESAAPALTSIGPLQLAPALYEMYLAEARSHVDVLNRELVRCSRQAPSQQMVRSAHTLSSASATIGVMPLQELAHALEQALERFIAEAAVADAPVIGSAVKALGDMVAAIAAHRMPERADALGAELRVAIPPVAGVTAAASPAAPAVSEERRRQRIEDELDPQVLPLFLEEAVDLTSAIAAGLRGWREHPDDAAQAGQVQRLLHTLKGSARMAGAMAIGELAHSMETRIEQALPQGAATAALLDELEASFDREVALIDGLKSPPAAPGIESLSSTAADVPEIATGAGEAVQTSRALLRVRAEDIDQLVNEGGEIALARSRIESEMRVLRNSLRDLTDNVLRLRGQLREIEIQAESQIQSRRATSTEHHEGFDPLEMDRFTRLQELTRIMAESVNDVATVQHNLLRNLDHAEAALAAQARLNRDLSQRLMNVRMVPLSSVAERLYRVVRQTAKELDKRANLDIRGGQTELDRSVLEKMLSPIEHLLRNAVAHGLESRDARRMAGKPEQGEIVFSVSQEGNEIVMDLMDDGAGLDFAAIRAKAEQRGLLATGQAADEAHLAQLIFAPGFTTAEQLSEISGRGVGMDVVHTETAALGGRIELNSQAGRGMAFRIYLPVTLSIAQVVLVKSGSRTCAIPSAMVEQVNEMKPEAIAKIRADGYLDWQDGRYPWHYLPRLLGDAGAHPEERHRYWLVLIRGGKQCLAMEVDELVGNREVVVKNIGPQLARVAGIAGATVLDDGEIALMLNPIALAGRETNQVVRPEPVPQGDFLRGVEGQPSHAEAVQVEHVPTVMVVDDSITVRKIASRQLERAGYRVLTAKDGVDALEQLQETLPDVMLADIEMPRMDGFDLARNVRADTRLKKLPIIMITSRIADKHRNYASEIGVDHYLGKPYDEQELLKLVAGYVAAR